MSTPWQTLPQDELKLRLRTIARQTKTDDEFRDKVVTELGYPYSRDEIAVTSDRTDADSMVSAILHHRDGTVSI